MIFDYQPTSEREGIILYDNIMYKNRMSDFLRESTPLKMNIMKPAGLSKNQKLPLYVWLEGGAWSNSTPFYRIPELTYFVKNGFIVADVQYSRNHHNSWPACIEDVKAAIRFLRFYSEDYGIDVNNIFVGGESAGAHLAALAGLMDQGQFTTREYENESDHVNGVISYYGVGDTDIDIIDYFNFYDQLVHKDINSDLKLKKEINPIHYVHENSCPFLLLHGDQDGLVPCQCSRNLYQALIDSGNEADLYIVKGADHADLAFNQEGIKELVLQFMKRNLR